MKIKVYSLMTLLLFLVLLLMIGCTPNPTIPPLSVYYVAPVGNDTNNGSLTSPWKTIQYALDTPSEDSFKVILQPGTYQQNKIDFPDDKEIYLLGEAGPESTVVENIGTDEPVIRIHSVSKDIKIEGITITGAEGDKGGGLWVWNSVLEMINCKIENNSATCGGGIFAFTSNLSLKDCQINNNYASSGYGGINCQESSLSMDNCTIDSNTTDGDAGGLYVYWVSSTLDINQCTFSNNTSGGDGGGIYLWTAGNSTITNSMIKNNSANDVGGGIYVYDPQGTITIHGNTVCNNASEEGITTENQIVPNTYPDNTLLTTCPNANNPSSVHNLTQNTYHGTIQDALEKANNADTIEVDDGIYQENIIFPPSKSITLRSANGASLTTIKGTEDNPTVWFKDSLLTGTLLEGFTVTHQIGASGNGMIVNNSIVTVDSCIVKDNQSPFSGGGISNSHDSNLTIINSTITNNSTEGMGGGINTYQSDLTITGSTISSNSALDNGGGIYIWSSVGGYSIEIGGDSESEKNIICGNYLTGDSPSLDQQIMSSLSGSLYSFFRDTNHINLNCL